VFVLKQDFEVFEPDKFATKAKGILDQQRLVQGMPCRPDKKHNGDQYLWAYQ
jgi:hypothetical protein